MSTLGKRNPDDDNRASIEFFFMYSWTRDEYRAAVQDEEFLNSVKVYLDATPPSDMNEETTLTGDEYLNDVMDKKIYYAGGSSRYMFQLSTGEVISRIGEAIKAAPNKADLVKYCVGMYHKDEINRLYGLNENRERYAVSEYALSCFVNASGKDTIVELAKNLGLAQTPPMHGYLFEWLFLATVKEEKVELIDVNSENVPLPMTEVCIFDPTKNFKTTGEGEEHHICADKKWLKPVKWNQGGYDALYFDMVTQKVIFIQLTIATKHDLKLKFFDTVLSKLVAAGMKEMKVEIYFVVKAEKLEEFKISNVVDSDVLEKYDSTWATQNVLKRVQILAFNSRL
ncbi:hypothetical protein LEN26_007048 [Aphanomyces euteiches]|nr:hypothetical protein LEN26_007048 [Aphanomyces euteiches]